MIITHTAKFPLYGDTGGPITCGELLEQVEKAEIPNGARMAVEMGTVGWGVAESREATHITYTWETSL